jgi:hypothetical protein
MKDCKLKIEEMHKCFYVYTVKEKWEEPMLKTVCLSHTAPTLGPGLVREEG